MIEDLEVAYNPVFDNMYFTPHIEDIHIGYECEIYNYKDKRWNKHIIGNPLIFAVDDFYKLFEHRTENNKNISDYIRTNYLTQEQIENEGWVVYAPFRLFNFLEKEENEYHYLFKKNIYNLSYNTTTNKLSIYKDDKINVSIHLFNGYCKSINELKLIMKLLNIQ